MAMSYYTGYILLVFNLNVHMIMKGIKCSGEKTPYYVYYVSVRS